MTDTTSPSAHIINLQGAQMTGGATASAGQASAGSLPDPLAEKRAKFTIPEEIQKKYPGLIDLILVTESMTDDERQYWFQILPVMTEDQVKKFEDILNTEKKQLQKLDQEYEDQLKKLNDRHLIEWQDFETREKRRAIEKAETSAKAEDKATEESLLQQLDDL